MLKQLMIAACMVLTSTLSLVGTIHAERIENNFTIEVTDQNVGASADHTVTFVTPSGVDAPGDVIVFTYGSGADLSNISVLSDITLSVDDDGACDGSYSSKTLASTASLNVWGVDLSGQNITFTPPTNASTGEIDAGRCVRVTFEDIGNPTSVTSVQLSIAGPFGDSGVAAFSVSDSTQVTVTARVGLGGEAGVSDTPPSDTTPPVIYNVETSNVGETSATISWLTDDYADTLLEWGTDTEYALGQLSDIQLLLTHSETITDLTPGVEYYTRITSADFVGNAAVYDLITFTTGDSTAPILIDPQVTQVGTTTATVQWLTDELSDSVVEYGLTESYDIGSVSEDEFVTDHVLYLTGLESGTSYHVRVRSTDVYVNEGVSEDIEFETLTDSIPSNVTLSVTAGDASNFLIWTLPSDDDLAGVRVIYRTDRYPSDPFDGELISTDLVTSFEHTGLTNGTTYYYGAFAYDVGGNIASGALASVTPFGSDAGSTDSLSETETDTDTSTSSVGIDEDTSIASTSSTSSETTSNSGSIDEDTSTPLRQGYEGEPSLSEEDSVDIDEPVIASEEKQSPVSTVQFSVANGSISLSPVEENSYRVLTGLPFIVGVSTDDPTYIQSATVTFNGSAYNLSDITGISDGKPSAFVFGRIASIDAPSVGTYTVTVSVTYTDGTSQTFTYTLEVISFGQVFEMIEDQSERIDGVRLELYEYTSDGWTLFDASRYGEQNPLISSQDDNLAWYVPNGTYDLRGYLAGYLPARTGKVVVDDNIVIPALRLYRVPVTVTEILVAPLPLEEKVQQVVGEIVTTVQALYETVSSSLLAEAVEAPVMAAAVGTTTVGSLSLLFLFSGSGSLRIATTCPRTKREWDEKEKQRQRRRRNHHYLLRASLIACAIITFLRPTTLNLVVLAVSLSLTLLTKKLVKKSS